MKAIATVNKSEPKTCIFGSPTVALSGGTKYESDQRNYTCRYVGLCCDCKQLIPYPIPSHNNKWAEV